MPEITTEAMKAFLKVLPEAYKELTEENKEELNQIFDMENIVNVIEDGNK